MFYFVIPFLVLCIALMVWKITDEWKTYENDKIDTIGSILYGIGILLFIYGFTTLTTSTGLILTILGLIILVVFGAYELRQKSPVFNMNLFKNKKFTSSNIAALCSYIAKHCSIMQLHCSYGSYNNIELPLPVCKGMGCSNGRYDLDYHTDYHGYNGP